MYKGYLETITRRFEAQLSKINAEYNFDFGDEFEFALMDFLQAVLPERFGIRRGHAVTIDNQSAGDDLIIFDRLRMPTIGLRDGYERYRKTKIPVEAIYAYIEAKHTLILEGDGPQSLNKACSQVGNVRALCERRIRSQLNVGKLPKELHFAAAHGGYPDRLDPMLGVLFARNVKLKERDKVFASGVEIERALHKMGGRRRNDPTPDLFLLGSDVVLSPFLDRADKDRSEYVSPFYLPSRSHFGINVQPGRAAAFGICTMMYALELIQLGPMPWRSMISEGLGPLDDLQFRDPPSDQPDSSGPSA